jgi:hypothetical protein
VRPAGDRRIFAPRRRPNWKLEVLAGAATAVVVGGVFASAQIAIGPAHRPFHTGEGPLLWLSAVVAAFAFGVHVGRMRALLVAAVPAAIAVALEVVELDESHRPSPFFATAMILAVAFAAACGVAARIALRPR